MTNRPHSESFMRTRTRFATVLTLACLAASAAHCGMGNTGFDATVRDGASDARSDGAPTDSRIDAGGPDVRDAALDNRAADTRPDTTTTDVRADVPRTDVARAEGGSGGTCGDPCMANDECAGRCGAMSGGVFCCSYSASEPTTPGTCYFSATTACGGTGPMTDDGGGAGGDGDLDDAGGLDDAAGGDTADLDF